jgi:hypothetical protein
MDHLNKLASDLSTPIDYEQEKLQQMSVDDLVTLMKTAAPTAGQVLQYGVGKAIRSAKNMAGTTGQRAAKGAVAGAVGGAVAGGMTSGKNPDGSEPGIGKKVLKGAVAGAAGGAAGAAVAKPTAKAILKMKGPVGSYARKSVNASRVADVTEPVKNTAQKVWSAVKKPFTKKGSVKLKIAVSLGTIGGFGRRMAGGLAQHAITTPAATRMAVGAGVGAVGGALAGGKEHRLGGALGGAVAGAGAGYVAPHIAQRIQQMAGTKINRQAGMGQKLLGGGPAAKQTVNVG